jgi:hypothetical protein
VNEEPKHGFADVSTIQKLTRLLAAPVIEPSQRAARIQAVEKDIVLPLRLLMITILGYYFFFSGWLDTPGRTPRWLRAAWKGSSTNRGTPSADWKFAKATTRQRRSRRLAVCRLRVDWTKDGVAMGAEGIVHWLRKNLGGGDFLAKNSMDGLCSRGAGRVDDGNVDFSEQRLRQQALLGLSGLDPA